MKYFILSTWLCSLFILCNAQSPVRFNDTSLLKPIEINAVRATDKTPVSKTTLSRDEIEKNNTGRDLPFILDQTASVVVNSDAGNGIGYTGIHIRGTDAARINVTLNGIPYNDAESQGTFFVDLPDIASSAGNIQVQRGVGTSSNGGGAFGGSINISTNDIIEKKGLEFSSNAGSYHSFRNSLVLNSGIFAKHFTINGRLSDIRSDGYVDRASSRLRSFYTSAAYIDAKNSLRVNIFSGKEKTYQAWYGIDEYTLLHDRQFNAAGTEKADTPYNNETDNYVQTHYQIFYNRKFNDYWKGNIALFLTNGKGYYEEYKAQQLLSDYGLPLVINGNDTIAQTNLVRRLWLDNNFYGSIFSAQYEKKKMSVIIGGCINKYEGDHFGEIIYAEQQQAVPKNYRWYEVKADKKDFSGYIKWTQQLLKNWQTFIDIQGRSVSYNLYGFEDNPTLIVRNNYFFLTPKAGVTYTKNRIQWYMSYARGAKEPNRDDFEANKTEQPSPEHLNDFETGFEYKRKTNNWAVTVYYMDYKNQLVLTGKINDVGAYTRTNIPSSFRTGIELQGGVTIVKWLSFRGNIAFSENSIKNFTEYLDNYDNGEQQLNRYNKTTIAFSPSVISSASVNILPLKNMELNLIHKYVSKQYLDNTSNKSRALKPYYLQDVRLSYLFSFKKEKTLRLFIQANNIFSKKYEPNGYSYSYISGGVVNTENYYFPMAPFNVMAGLTLKL